MMPLAKALDVLQSDKIPYTVVLETTISILLEKMEQMKHGIHLRHCNPLVNAIINGVNRDIVLPAEQKRCPSVPQV